MNNKTELEKVKAEIESKKEEKMEYEGGCNCSINVIWYCTCSGTGFFDRQLFISHYRWNYGRRYVFNDCNREWFGLE